MRLVKVLRSTPNLCRIFRSSAMRYTEARMSKITLEMLRDINKDTIDFQPNYDGTEREPVVLPARFPNLLVNGALAIFFLHA